MNGAVNLDSVRMEVRMVQEINGEARILVDLKGDGLSVLLSGSTQAWWKLSKIVGDAAEAFTRKSEEENRR